MIKYVIIIYSFRDKIVCRKCRCIKIEVQKRVVISKYSQKVILLKNIKLKMYTATMNKIQNSKNIVVFSSKHVI